ncbi:YycH family regulatory protein [Levilactobacillus namurensis]|uniref:YycH family regulatory protein n=1 Tax=Levilactobacillus namurensis TaxID=380393 RepID=UPI0026EEB103|nr:two-component system activity regulator YycH [Levilactobacillus namurensis]
MKITKALLPVGLTIAVVISVTLSALIWTNPAQYERNRQRSSNNPTTELNTRPQRDVYLPTQVIHTDATGKQQLLNNRKINLTSEIRTAMSAWQFGHITHVRDVSHQDYMDYVSQKNSLLLSYASPVNVKIFNTVFGAKITRSSSQFSRIMVPLNDARHVYLLDDRNQDVYRVTVKDASTKRLKAILRENLFRMTINMQWLNGSAMAYMPNSVTVQSYSYLVNHQSTDYFTSRLLNNGEATNVTAKKNKDNTVYSDGTSKQLTVYNKPGIALYEDYSAMQTTLSFNQQLTASYDAVKSMGIPMENLRYYGYSGDNNTVTYRSFVEGFPIFNQSDYGAARIQILSQGVRRYNFSLYSLQVPVPNDKKSITLPGTQAVIDQLTAAGYRQKKIESIQLGYQWAASSASDKVVDLTPTWYINYDGTWKNYTQLLK